MLQDGELAKMDSERLDMVHLIVLEHPDYTASTVGFVGQTQIKWLTLKRRIL